MIQLAGRWSRVNRSHIRRSALLAAGAAAVALVVSAGPTPAVGASAAQDPTTTLPGVGDTIPPPSVTVSDDGRSATTGTTTLTASAAADLPAAGSTLTVTGEGFDTFKGIYVALCVVPTDGGPPSPCGGGADTEGSSGSSIWISSNPPPYGTELAIPYGAAGDFSVELSASPVINDDVDCRKVQCAVVSRNDHIRSTDRSQDIFIPVTFEGSELEPVEDAASEDATSEESSGDASADEGSSSALLIGAGLAAVVIVAGGLVVGTRRSRRN